MCGRYAYSVRSACTERGLDDPRSSDEDSVARLNREWTSRLAGWVLGLPLPMGMAALTWFGTMLAVAYAGPVAHFAIWLAALIGLVQWAWLVPTIASAWRYPWLRPFARALIVGGIGVIVANVLLVVMIGWVLGGLVITPQRY